MLAPLWTLVILHTSTWDHYIAIFFIGLITLTSKKFSVIHKQPHKVLKCIWGGGGVWREALLPNSENFDFYSSSFAIKLRCSDKELLKNFHLWPYIRALELHASKRICGNKKWWGPLFEDATKAREVGDETKNAHVGFV